MHFLLLLLLLAQTELLLMVAVRMTTELPLLSSTFSDCFDSGTNSGLLVTPIFRLNRFTVNLLPAPSLPGDFFCGDPSTASGRLPIVTPYRSAASPPQRSDCDLLTRLRGAPSSRRAAAFGGIFSGTLKLSLPMMVAADAVAVVTSSCLPLRDCIRRNSA